MGAASSGLMKGSTRASVITEEQRGRALLPQAASAGVTQKTTGHRPRVHV